MKVSYAWLQEYVSGPLPPVEKLVEYLTMHSFEIESVETIGEDKILDVKVMPNRTHDCLSHYGIASEIAAVSGLETVILLPNQSLPTSGKLKLSINTKLCSRAVIVYIEGIKVGKSPTWLKEKLKPFGYKPINSIVDITNYLTLAYGQPVHVFDADKLAQKKKSIEINIRESKKDEKITLLDNKGYTLTPGMLVISDKEKALDVAGIMGGKESGVEPETKNIILSLSNFDAVSIRKTSKSLGLRTDASIRFENGISPSLISRTMPYALNLISELTGGTVVAGVDLYPIPQKDTEIRVTSEKISKILGTDIDKITIAALLGRQKIKTEKNENEIIVRVPLERLDLNITEDIAEEVGRLYGYDKIPPIPLSLEKEVEVNRENYFSDLARDALLKEGFSEIYTYAFTDSGEVELENPKALDKSYLRRNLSRGMESSLDNNFKYTDLLGVSSIKLFEIGKIFTKEDEFLHLSIGVRYQKGKKDTNHDEEIAKTIHVLEKTFDISIGDVSIVGGVAEIDLGKIINETKVSVDKNKVHKFEKNNIVYKTISPYPFAVRDVAVFVPQGTDKEKVENIIKNELNYLVIRFSLFDTFTKNDKVSYAFRLVFQSQEKTLTEAEINAVMKPIYEALKAEPLFEIR